MIGQKKRQENPMPLIDEDWWVSVLTEESRIKSTHPARFLGTKSGIRGDPQSQALEKKPVTNWALVKDLFIRDQIIDLVVTGHNRGGLLVEGSGMFGFVPISHLVELESKPDKDQRNDVLESYFGRVLHLKVIECAPEDGRVIFSERAARSQPGTRAELLHALRPGQQVRGVVTNVTDFGVFVDLGGVEGLIHISELSWGRVSHPSQIVQVGETLDVQVLDLVAERCRVALSLKRLKVNPWENAVSDFPIGQVLAATITSVLSFGAFARLSAGLEGLIHVSEIPHTNEKSLKDVLVEGQNVQVRVLHVDALHHRMGLSMKIK